MTKRRAAIKPFERLLGVLDALPSRVEDGVPLLDVIPGLWPTVGDLRELVRAYGETEPTKERP